MARPLWLAYADAGVAMTFDYESSRWAGDKVQARLWCEAHSEELRARARELGGYDLSVAGTVRFVN